MSPEKGPQRQHLPDQEFLQENEFSLERLRQEHGDEHALLVARKAEHDIELFIENDLRPAAAESAGWLADELPKWEEKLAGIRRFIATLGEENDE